MLVYIKISNLSQPKGCVYYYSIKTIKFAKKKKIAFSPLIHARPFILRVNYDFQIF